MPTDTTAITEATDALRLDAAFNRATVEGVIAALCRWMLSDRCPPELARELRVSPVFTASGYDLSGIPPVPAPPEGLVWANYIPVLAAPDIKLYRILRPDEAIRVTDEINTALIPNSARDPICYDYYKHYVDSACYWAPENSSSTFIGRACPHRVFRRRIARCEVPGSGEVMAWTDDSYVYRPDAQTFYPADDLGRPPAHGYCTCVDYEESATAEPAPAPVPEHNSYRMLREGEIIEQGDEFFNDGRGWEPSRALGQACTVGNRWRRPAAIQASESNPSAITFEVGDGYRVLCVGETIEDGDEYLNPLSGWTPSGLQSTRCLHDNYMRRLIAPPLSASATNPGVGWRLLVTGETIEPGDELFRTCASPPVWVPLTGSAVAGNCECEALDSIRRRLCNAVPAPVESGTPARIPVYRVLREGENLAYGDDYSANTPEWIPIPASRVGAPVPPHTENCYCRRADENYTLLEEGDAIEEGDYCYVPDAVTLHPVAYPGGEAAVRGMYCRFHPSGIVTPAALVTVPGAGYDFVASGDIVREGDEQKVWSTALWIPATKSIGRLAGKLMRFRRPVTLRELTVPPAIVARYGETMVNHAVQQMAATLGLPNEFMQDAAEFQRIAYSVLDGPVATATQRSVRASEPFTPLYRILRRDEPVRVTDEYATALDFPPGEHDTFDTFAEIVSNDTSWSPAPLAPDRFLEYSRTRMWRRRETHFRFVTGNPNSYVYDPNRRTLCTAQTDYVYSPDAVTLRPAQIGDYTRQQLFCKFVAAVPSTRPPPVGYLLLDASDVVQHEDMMWLVGHARSGWVSAACCINRQAGGGMLFARPIPLAATAAPVSQSYEGHRSAPGEDE